MTTNHHNCTPEQAQQAVEYLRMSFGGFPIPDMETRSHLRLYLGFTPQEVRDAIDALVRSVTRRPGPNQVAQALRVARRKAVDAAPPEPYPGAVSAHESQAFQAAIAATKHSRRSTMRTHSPARKTPTEGANFAFVVLDEGVRAGA